MLRKDLSVSSTLIVFVDSGRQGLRGSSSELWAAQQKKEACLSVSNPALWALVALAPKTSRHCIYQTNCEMHRSRVSNCDTKDTTLQSLGAKACCRQRKWMEGRCSG